MIRPAVQPALNIQSASKSFASTRAVDNVSFTIEAGEIFGLLGPNGAGKSTLINMISGLCNMTQGSIQIFGQDNKEDFRLTRRMTGVMPQEIVIDNFFDLDKSLRLHAGYYGFDDDPEWRQTLIERLELTPYLKKRPLQLSGGTKRRHMLAKALIHKPKLLILDEPTAGVDVELRHSIWTFVREINQLGTTVLLTTHYIEEAQAMCGRIAILSQGKIVALDTTQKLLERIDDRCLWIHYDRPVQNLGLLAGHKSLRLSQDARSLSIALTSEDDIGEWLQKIQTLPARILDIQINKANLEDVFLKITKRKDSTDVEEVSHVSSS